MDMFNILLGKAPAPSAPAVSHDGSTSDTVPSHLISHREHRRSALWPLNHHHDLEKTMLRRATPLLPMGRLAHRNRIMNRSERWWWISAAQASRPWSSMKSESRSENE